MANETPGVNDKPLEHFKDWSNYLLVTTVAALGWVATKEVEFLSPWLRAGCIVALAVSIMFGIFTLALIPLVGEQRTNEPSFYDVRANYRLFRRKRSNRLKDFCFWQHAFFLVGIVLYAIGTIWKCAGCFR